MQIDSQLVSVEEHDGKSSLVGTFTAISIRLFKGAVWLSSSYRPSTEQNLRKHLLIADYRRPGRVTFEAREVVLAGLGIQMRQDL